MVISERVWEAFVLKGVGRFSVRWRQHCHNKRVTEATYNVWTERITRTPNHCCYARSIATGSDQRRVLSLCTGTKELIQKTKQYTSPNQCLLNKENTMVVPLCTDRRGKPKGSCIRRLDFYRECVQWYLNEPTEVCPFCSFCSSCWLRFVSFICLLACLLASLFISQRYVLTHLD